MARFLFTVFFLLVFVFFSGNLTTNQASANEILPLEFQYSFWMYQTTRFPDNKPDFKAFQTALTGFQRLKNEGKLADKQVLTLIDFTLPSTKKRLWTIDLETGATLFHSYVAHGRNSGENTATQFGNLPGSYKSSLGFYVTGETYFGKHGLSLYLHGMEPGFNDKALERAVVLHGADYVSEDFIKNHGRLGRSFGCPSVPMEIRDEIIATIKNKTCLFIYYPEPTYEAKSEMIKPLEILASIPSGTVK